jgi:hypothetical protein
LERSLIEWYLSIPSYIYCLSLEHTATAGEEYKVRGIVYAVTNLTPTLIDSVEPLLTRVLSGFRTTYKPCLIALTEWTSTAAPRLGAYNELLPALLDLADGSKRVVSFITSASGADGGKRKCIPEESAVMN